MLFRSGQTVCAIALPGILTAKFVVDLPGNHMRVLRIMFRHYCGNPSRMRLIDRAVVTIMPPASKSSGLPEFVLHIYFRMFVHQPFWRSCRGCSHDHVNPLACQRFHRVIQPGEIIISIRIHLLSIISLSQLILT